jgi:hypothetical protein
MVRVVDSRREKKDIGAYYYYYWCGGTKSLGTAATSGLLYKTILGLRQNVI